jgi:hypothetical protein
MRRPHSDHTRTQAAEAATESAEQEDDEDE